MLDQLIGAAPASTVDVDAVVRRTRRRRRVRHLAAGGSTAVAVIAAVAVGAGLLPGAGPEPEPAPAPPAAAASPSAPALQAGTAAGRQQILDRLQTVLERAAAEHAPAVRWIYMPDVPGEKRTPDGHPVMFALNDETFRARSGVTAGGRKGGFYLSLRAVSCPGGETCQPFYECNQAVAGCEAARSPSGLRLVRYVEKPGPGWLFYGVDVELPDRKHAVQLSAPNYFGGDGSAPSAPAPVFTRAQLEAIAIDVAEQMGR
ncbi:hypothetical protein [Actinoplanes sp. CA-252034]|uniref:hypothetical protein n=1 Tax=Actinoplanes sp. CA-252034 TaxID=3239906 RepID=UPI003D97F8C3